MRTKTKRHVLKSKNGVNAEVTSIKLSKDSRKSIKSCEKSEKKAKHELRSICGDTVYDIEASRWHGPVRSYDFGDMKEDWEYEKVNADSWQSLKMIAFSRLINYINSQRPHPSGGNSDDPNV